MLVFCLHVCLCTTPVRSHLEARKHRQPTFSIFRLDFFYFCLDFYYFLLQNVHIVCCFLHPECGVRWGRWDALSPRALTLCASSRAAAAVPTRVGMRTSIFYAETAFSFPSYFLWLPPEGCKALRTFSLGWRNGSELRAFVTPAKNPGSVPAPMEWLTTIHNSSSREPHSALASKGTKHVCLNIHIWRQNTNTY